MSTNGDSARRLVDFIEEQLPALVDHEIRNRSVRWGRMSNEADINAFAYHHVRNVLVRATPLLTPGLS